MLTVYGIETCDDFCRKTTLVMRVATVLTVYGIETLQANPLVDNI